MNLTQFYCNAVSVAIVVNWSNHFCGYVAVCLIYLGAFSACVCVSLCNFLPCLTV